MSDLINQFVERTNNGLLTNIGAGANQLVQGFKAKEAARVKEEGYQTALTNFGQAQTPENMLAIQRADPAQFEAFKTGFDAMNELERTNTVQENVELMGLLASGNEETAIERARTKAEAYRNNGDMGEAKVWDGFAEKIENGEGQSLTNYLMGINTGAGKIGQDANQSWFDQKESIREENRFTKEFIEDGVNLEFASQAHKNKVLSEANKMDDPVLARLFAEMGSIVGGEDGSGLDANQEANYAFKLNKEYDTRTGEYRTVGDSADKIRGLMDQGTGFGDQGMIMLFNKVLDPPSVVRESEAKMTADNQSLVNRGRTLLASLEAGERLSDPARKELMAAVEVMSTLAKDNITEVQDRMNPLVDKYLKEENRPLVYGPSLENQVEENKVPVQSVENKVPTINEEASGGVPTITDSTPLGEAELNAKRVAVAEANPNSVNKDRFATMSNEELNMYAAGRNFVYSGESESTQTDTINVVIPTTHSAEAQAAMRTFLYDKFPNQSNRESIKTMSGEMLERLFSGHIRDWEGQYYSENPVGARKVGY